MYILSFSVKPLTIVFYFYFILFTRGEIARPKLLQLCIYITSPSMQYFVGLVIISLQKENRQQATEHEIKLVSLYVSFL